MKNYLYFTRLSVVILLALSSCVVGNTQTLLIENFDYPSGATVTSNGWIAHSASGNNPVLVGSPGLVFPGYPSSNIGLAAMLVNDGECVNRPFSLVISGSVFCAFLMKVNSVRTDYFLHLSNTTASSYRGRVYIKGSGSSFNIGLSKGEGSASYTTGSPYSTGTTYLIVLKYSVVDGTYNDIVSLYIFTGSIPSTEPATPSLGPLNDASQSDLTNVSSVALRQYSATQNIIVDGIRIARTWPDAVGIPTNTGIEISGLKPVLYPVPVLKDLTISNIEGYDIIEILDLTGRILITVKKDAENIVIVPVVHLPSGLYIAKIKSSYQIKSIRFIKI
jgi:hypothetical protein